MGAKIHSQRESTDAAETVVSNVTATYKNDAESGLNYAMARFHKSPAGKVYVA